MRQLSHTYVRSVKKLAKTINQSENSRAVDRGLDRSLALARFAVLECM